MQNYDARVKRLGDAKSYQDTLGMLFAGPQPVNTKLPDIKYNPDMSIASATPGNVTFGGAGPLASQADTLQPILAGLSPEVGMPVALEQVLAMNKPKAPIKLGKNDRLFDPNDLTKPIVDAAPEPVDYNKPYLPDGRPNEAYQAYTLRNARAGAPSISMNTEKGYAATVAGKLAENDAAVLDAARSAPQRIQSAQAVLKILDTQAPITGTGANARLALDKALSTAGLVDGKNVVSTENLASELAAQTLDAIKSSGLGSGQGFTDKDRQFLEKARAGNIELNAGTLHYLARKNEEAARAAIRRGNTIAKRLKGDKNFGSVGQDLEVPEPPAYKQETGVDALVNKYLGK